MMESEKEISKYTLEAVFQAQESIRKHLDDLIKENRALKNIEERDTFFRELTYSTLGLGIDKRVTHLVKGYLGIRADVETFGRWLADQYSNKVFVPMELYKSIGDSEKAKQNEVPISELWQVLKDNLFSVFPLAIDRACRMSKEREEKSGISEFDIDND